MTITPETGADLHPIHRALKAIDDHVAYQPDGKLLNQAYITPGFLAELRNQNLVHHILTVDHKAGDPLPADKIELALTELGRQTLAVHEAGGPTPDS